MMKIESLSNKSKLGIFSFRICDGLNLNPGSVCDLAITNESGVTLSKISVDLDQVLKFGINVHEIMLEPGFYKLNVICNDAVISEKFESIDRRELSTRVRDGLLKKGTPLIFVGDCDSSLYPYDDDTLIPWFDRSDAEDHIDRLKKEGAIDECEDELLRSFLRDGFMVLENLIDIQDVAAMNSDLDKAIAQKHAGYEYGSSQRLEHLHLKYDSFKKIMLNKKIKKYVDLIFQDESRPCQTLTFVFGSQQDEHQDAIHLTPFPAGYMCGVWIALQDVNEHSGELIVFPGSHKEPRLRMVDFDCKKIKDGNWTEFGQKVVPKWIELSEKYPSVVYRPKKGTVLIWHENLMHAGSKRLNKELERRSVVIHYFANSAVGYYDSTGLPAMALSLDDFK